jgi:urease accessory protein
VSSRDGKGHIVLSRFGETQVISTLSFQYPLKLISPRLPGQPCTSVFMMSYGGGLVGGDQIDLSVIVQRDSKLALLTQGSTKIFKQRKSVDSETFSPPTSQTLKVKIDDGGLLALLPDPIQPFADSCYNQLQSFEMHPTSNLMLLDWVNSGRPARGENWTLSSFRSRNDIFEISDYDTSKRLVLRDTQIMNNDVASSMQTFECFAMVILRGPLFQDFSASIIAKFKKEDRVRRPSTYRQSEQKERATWTAGIVRDGCCVVKIAAERGEMVKEFLRELLVVEDVEKIIGREALRALV